MATSTDVVVPKDGRLSFCEIQDVTILLPILAERHPVSCMMHNQVVRHKHFKEDLKFYSIGEDINSNTWIISNHIREVKRPGFRMQLRLIGTSYRFRGYKPIPAEVKECISKGGLIRWENLQHDFMYFGQMPKPLVAMIVEISVYEKGYMTEIHPGSLYYMETADALNLEITHEDPSVEVRRLDASKNEAEFILRNWTYKLPGSEIVLPKCLARNASGAVFVNGECVSSVYITGTGLLSALHTVKGHRNKGYARLAMKYAFKEYAKDGCIPCLSIEAQNDRSVRFHEGLGMKVASYINAILIKRLPYSD